MTSRLDDLPHIEPASREEWSVWLEANSASAAGVWVAIGKKDAVCAAPTYEQAIEEALRFNWIDSKAHALDDERWQNLFTPRKPGSTWSRSNKERVERLAAQDLLTRAAISAIEDAKADGSWNQLDDIDNLVVPNDLAEALASQPGAEAAFGALTESQRKLTLYWISTARQSETRRKRIEATVAAAAEGKAPR